MAKRFDAVIDTPVGRVGIKTHDGVVTEVALALAPDTHPLKPASTDITRRAVAQLNSFFEDPGHSFDLPLGLRGTAFQLRVLEALTKIPAGETRTYGELAKELNTSARAVGGACRSNPCPIFVPCHRVVAAGGGLGGFGGRRGGEWLAIKRDLLRMENLSTR